MRVLLGWAVGRGLVMLARILPIMRWVMLGERSRLPALQRRRGTRFQRAVPIADLDVDRQHGDVVIAGGAHDRVVGGRARG